MYAPKRQEFDLLVMDARVKLAAIDFNANVNRKQDTVKVSRRGSANVGEKKKSRYKVYYNFHTPCKSSLQECNMQF